MGKTSNKHKIITSEVNPTSDIFSFLIFKYFTTGRRYREYRKSAEKKLLFVMIHSNGSARPRPDNQVCSFYQYQYCTVTSSNVRASSSLVHLISQAERERGRRGGGGAVQQALFGEYSGLAQQPFSFPATVRAERRESSIRSSGQIAASKTVKVYPGYNRDFFLRAGIECGGNTSRSAGRRRSQILPNRGERFGSFFLPEIHKLSTETL